jgi:pilus assembly protein CpaE
MTNILAVAVDPTFQDRLRSIPGHTLVTIGRENVASVRERMRNQTFMPELIFVGEGLSPERALQYSRGVLKTYPETTIVLVAPRNRRLRKEAGRAGVHTVVATTVGDRELAELCAAAGRTDTPTPAPPTVTVDTTPVPHQVIVVASPKGGVGKTTAAVNLAAVLAESCPGEVVVLDLDLQFGDVATVLDLSPEWTLADALASGADDSMLLRTLVVPHPAHFSVLCGANHPADIGHVNGDRIRKLVHEFASSFRYVVIDTSAGLQEETLASLEEATDVVFVATLDVATLRDVRKEVDVLAELGLMPERRHLVLNRVDRLSGLTERDAANIVGIPVEFSVPASPQVPLASNHANLVVNHRKAKNVRQPIQHFAGTISGQSRRETGRLR